MTLRRNFAGALLAVACAGCALVPFAEFPKLGTSAATTNAADNARIQVTPQFSTTAQRGIQAAVSVYSVADVNHLLLKLFTVAADVETPALNGQGIQIQVDNGIGQLTKAVVFSNLKNETTYRVRAYAYKAGGTDSADLISSSDGTSAVDLVVVRDDRPAMANIPVQLIDKVFDGRATASTVVFIDGGIIYPGTEDMQ